MKNDPKKILLVQLFSNGDCLYATAVARQIKFDNPGCHLTWAIADFCCDIISGNPYVDAVIVTNEVPKSDAAAFRRYTKKIFREKAAGLWDDVVVTTNMGANLALYDGTIRGMILRAYRRPVTVPLQPVLQLSGAEKMRVDEFAAARRLNTFKHVILWEFAPQSGQSKLSFDVVMDISRQLTRAGDTCVILSSAISFAGTTGIIDASMLSVRENAALTHYCDLLIGCSSGITWITTSSAAKFLPMVQLLDPDAFFLNAPSTDFRRFDIKHNGLIEMISFSREKIINCITDILQGGFPQGEKYNEPAQAQFQTTKKIVYNLLVYGEFSAISEHFKLNVAKYGKNKKFLRTFYGAIATAPAKLAGNFWRRVTKKKFQ